MYSNSTGSGELYPSFMRKLVNRWYVTRCDEREREREGGRETVRESNTEDGRGTETD